MNKLNGFGPVYVINLLRRTDRHDHIEKLFKEYNIINYTFIEAFDAQNDLSDLIQYGPVNNKSLRKEEIATTISHIKAIKYWLDNSNSEYAIFCEDDLSFDTVSYWDWTWEDFIKSINFDFDIIQLSITQFSNVNCNLHKKRRTDYSAGIYIIKRKHALSIINRMIEDNKYYIKGDRANSVVDHDVLFGNTEKSYSCALFTYDTNLSSDINPHGKLLHIKSRNKTMEFWKNTSIKLNDFISI